MDCPACEAPTVAVEIPEALREYAATAADNADDLSAVAVCTNCLRVYGSETPDSPADPGAVSDALPADEDAAVALLLAGSLLDSLAGNRRAIEVLVDRVVDAGVDPVLAFDRLADDPDLAPAVDLPKRYRQFEQLRG